MAATLPLNLQEEYVKERIEELHLGYRSHEVFALEKKSVVVDFFLPNTTSRWNAGGAIAEGGPR